MLRTLLLASFAHFAAAAVAPVAFAQDASPPPARCGTPTGPAPLASTDHPDCDWYGTNPTSAYAPTTLLRIPVVVHVIESTSGQGSLPDSLVRSQIAVLNQDYRAQAGTRGAGGTDTLIEFFLTTVDPNNQPTNGITHHANDTWFADQGAYWNSLAWDTQRFLNIYTNDVAGGAVLGYVPSLPQAGTELNTPADRVVVHWRAFGRPSLGSPPYDLGRTTTHEVGHYLGLFHTFDFGCDSGSCYASGDRVCDTAPEANPRYGCPAGAQSCGAADPITNYMDYTDDACMTGFTPEQTRRMRCTLQHYRSQLAQSLGPIATAVSRPGAGNANGIFTVNPPRLGQPTRASVLLFGSPYTLAAVYGFGQPASAPFLNQTVLVDLQSPLLLELPLQVSSTIAQWTFTVPNVPSLAGVPFHTQAVLFGTALGLTNAMDLVIGS